MLLWDLYIGSWPNVRSRRLDIGQVYGPWVCHWIFGNSTCRRECRLSKSKYFSHVSLVLSLPLSAIPCVMISLVCWCHVHSVPCGSTCFVYLQYSSASDIGVQMTEHNDLLYPEVKWNACIGKQGYCTRIRSEVMGLAHSSWARNT